ncbi:segregation/condensation protein A [Patescibacteria group bacterium]|nr:MAG: segregation/condensation protein A [Patescibacteria group bacterium]
MAHQNFIIKTGVFEGPLDLLLALIEKRKLFISDISLAKVADDYIAYLEGMKEFPIGTTAHFLLIASTLLLIKSKSLLPSLELSEEEESGISDLEARLRLYKRFRSLSVHVAALFGRERIYSRDRERFIQPIFSPHPQISPANIVAAAHSVLADLPLVEEIPKALVSKIVSLEEMIVKLTKRVKASLKLSFAEFTASGGRAPARRAGKRLARDEKLNIIVSFLALLELVKRGVVEAQQREPREDIHIESQDVGVPNYGQI